jgi:hypothetical protein
MGELAAGLRKAGGIGVVEDDHVDVEFFGSDLEIVSAGAGDNDLVACVAKALRDRATQIGVAAGNQHVHHADLLSVQR